MIRQLNSTMASFLWKEKRAAILISALVVLLLSSCATSRVSIVDKKYPAAQLREDYKIFRGALEENHPSLYWFTSKDSMNFFFDEGYDALKDSMTERQFRTVLTKVITSIRCGHTAVAYSKKIFPVPRYGRSKIISSCFQSMAGYYGSNG